MELYLKKNRVFYFDGEEVIANSGHSYELGDRLGAGGNGVVYECIDQNGMLYAIKFLLHFTEKSKVRFNQEISLMRRLHHPHIIQYIDDGSLKLRESRRSNQEQQALFVIMEKADLNLKDLLSQTPKIPYDIYAPQFRGLCEALTEIHQFAIHRDIKPENILVKGETWVLSDFGLCEFLNEDEHCDITGENEKIGPIFWISPEAVNKYYFGINEIGTYSDVYQMGMIFAFVLMKKFPGGILNESDFIKTGGAIGNIILKTLSNDYTKRPENGGTLLDLINDATINR
ncbi:MAG: protein kinase [Lachnospiraceae bacterium]|nr:protein kinase [Lachnospiraceae bacterium]